MTDLSGIKFIRSEFLAPSTVVCSPDVYDLIKSVVNRKLDVAVKIERLKFSRALSRDHNNFEPDNCNCEFCKQIEGLEKELQR